MKKLLLLIPVIVFTILSIRFIQAQPRSPGSPYVDVSSSGFNIISRQTSDLVVTQIVQSMVSGGVASNVIKNAAGNGIAIVTNSATLNTFYIDTNIVQAIDKEQAAGPGIFITTNSPTLNTIYLDTNYIKSVGVTNLNATNVFGNVSNAISAMYANAASQPAEAILGVVSEAGKFRFTITSTSPDLFGAQHGTLSLTNLSNDNGGALTNLNGAAIQSGTISSNAMNAVAYAAFMDKNGGVGTGTNGLSIVSTNGTSISPNVNTNLNFIGGTGIQIAGAATGNVATITVSWVGTIYGTNIVLYTNHTVAAVSNTLTVFNGPASYQCWQVNGNAAVTNTSGYGRTSLVVSNSLGTPITFSFPSTWRKIGSVTTNSAVLASGKMLQADIDVFPWATTYACAIEP